MLRLFPTIIAALALYMLPALALANDPVVDGLAGNQAADNPAGVRTNDASSQADRQIRERLAGIYGEIAPLRTIEVEVSSGVVRISGSVDSQANSVRAAQLAAQVDGVVDVENELILNRALEDRLESTGNQVVELFRTLIADLPLFGVALAVFALFWLAGRWLGHRHGFYRRFSPNVFIAELLGQVAHLVFIVLGLVLALALLDATALLGTILGAAGILGLALGFAVRDTVENYIASILLSIRNPFSVNDLVDIDGQVGNVVTLTSRATILLSPEGNHVRIPNAMVFKAVIVNFTRRPERRFDFDVGVDTEQDLREAQRIALDTLGSTPGVQSDPPLLVVVHALGDSNVVLRCFGWVDQGQHSFGKVRSEAIRRVKEAFDKAGIVMPEPVYRLMIADAANVLPDRDPGTERVEALTRTKRPDEAKASKRSLDEEPEVDVAPDHTIEARVIEDARHDSGQNLLSDKANQEI